MAFTHAPATLDLGTARVHWLRGGRFRLDGGAMFGPVPKPLWRRRYPCDEHNSIPMQASPLLVITPEARLLIDTGLGNKLDDKQRRIFRLEEDAAVTDDLTLLGLTPADIDFVIMTHMDWDHASGGAVYENGELVPAFPRARYVVQRAEWDACTNPTSRTQHGYWPENWRPLRDAQQVEIIDGEAEIVKGVRVYPTGGHTHGHQIVRIDGGADEDVGGGRDDDGRGGSGRDRSAGSAEDGTGTGQTLLHMGDVMPTHAHLNPLWVMGYDNFPLTSIAAKERWLPEAQAQRWWLSFYHDPFLLAGKLDDSGNFGHYVAGTLGWPPALD